MLGLINAADAQDMLRKQVRFWRLKDGLTQKGLAARSGVSLASLRRFERCGEISLASYLRLLGVLGGLNETVLAREPGRRDQYNSLAEVLAEARRPRMRKRGWRS